MNTLKFNDIKSQAAACEFGRIDGCEEEFEIVMHVHDELVAHGPADKSKEALERLIRCMTTLPPWAEGLPLGAHGFETTHYKKD